MPSYVRAGIRKCARIRALSLETAGLNWPKEKEIPDWAVLESVGKKKGIAHNSVDSDRKFLISGDNEAEIIQRSNHLIHG